MKGRGGRTASCAIFGAALLCACTPSLSVPEPAAGEIRSYIAKERSPLSVQFKRIWYAGGERGFLACGEMDADAGLDTIRSTLRFVYDLDRHNGQVEYHELWVALDGDMSIIEANRRIFNELWANHCAPYRPGLLWF